MMDGRTNGRAVRRAPPCAAAAGLCGFSARQTRAVELAAVPR